MNRIERNHSALAKDFLGAGIERYRSLLNPFRSCSESTDSAALASVAERRGVAMACDQLGNSIGQGQYFTLNLENFSYEYLRTVSSGANTQTTRGKCK